MALDLKNLSIRTVSGLVYASLLIGVILCGPVASAILLALFAAVATYEIEVNAIQPKNPDNWNSTWLLDAFVMIVLVLSIGIPGLQSFGMLIYIILLSIRFIVQAFIKQSDPIRSISIVCFEQFYIGLPLCIFVLMTDFFKFHPWVMVCGLAMIWINDTGAYLVGSMLGRHKMFPALSPKKSWEGFVGGLIFNIGAAFIFYYCFNLYSYAFLKTVYGWIVIGAFVTVFATIGDLFESMLKRSLGIKDFGNIIPGHGGVLDRIDSLLFVVPGITIVLCLFNSITFIS